MIYLQRSFHVLRTYKKIWRPKNLYMFIKPIYVSYFQFLLYSFLPFLICTITLSLNWPFSSGGKGVALQQVRMDRDNSPMTWMCTVVPKHAITMAELLVFQYTLTSYWRHRGNLPQLSWNKSSHSNGVHPACYRGYVLGLYLILYARLALCCG